MTRRTLEITLLIVALVVWGFACTAWAFTCTATGCTFDAKYTEPTTNTAGGPVNLTGTVIYYKVDGGAEKVIQVPPSSPSGGGAIKKSITEPILAGQKVVISGFATAKNAAGESVRAPLTSLTIDRSSEVTPNPPVAGSIE